MARHSFALSLCGVRGLLSTLKREELLQLTPSTNKDFLPVLSPLKHGCWNCLLGLQRPVRSCFEWPRGWKPWQGQAGHGGCLSLDARPCSGDARPCSASPVPFAGKLGWAREPGWAG